MYILTLVSPIQIAAAIGMCGMIALLYRVFRPLIIGTVRAGWLVVQPRLSAQQRQLRRRLKGARMLNRLANEAEATQPSLAAEMRCLAARE